MSAKGTSGVLQNAIRGTLTRRIAGAHGTSVVAEEALNLWLQMAARLSPVIGVRGVDVVFRRALHLTSTAFTWLETAGDRGANAPLLSDLKARLMSQEKDAALQASCALLAGFVELLTTLVGESLTDRLLSPVWALPTQTSDPESDS